MFKSQSSQIKSKIKNQGIKERDGFLLTLAYRCTPLSVKKQREGEKEKGSERGNEREEESDTDQQTDGALASLNKQAWRMRPNVKNQSFFSVPNLRDGVGLR